MKPLVRQLEADLIQNPDDLATHMAYGDYLAEQGDPRGELIQVQLALEDEARTSTDRQELLKREDQLFQKHWHMFIGPLKEFIQNRHSLLNVVTFRRGWIDTLRIGVLSDGLAQALVNTPALRLLRSLRLLDVVEHSSTGESGGLQALETLRAAPWLAQLRSLALGDLEGDGGFRSFPYPEALTYLGPRVPHLQELHLNVVGVVHSLLNLRLPHLRLLRLERARISDDQLPEFIRSGLLDSLRHLQIWNARMSDAGAALLASWPGIRLLESLDVSFNWLSPAGVESLRQVCPHVIAEYQMDEASDMDDEYQDFSVYEDQWE
jgi:uncharacterized protein (TIGR02996 family)